MFFFRYLSQKEEKISSWLKVPFFSSSIRQPKKKKEQKKLYRTTKELVICEAPIVQECQMDGMRQSSWLTIAPVCLLSKNGAPGYREVKENHIVLELTIQLWLAWDKPLCYNLLLSFFNGTCPLSSCFLDLLCFSLVLQLKLIVLYIVTPCWNFFVSVFVKSNTKVHQSTTKWCSSGEIYFKNWSFLSRKSFLTNFTKKVKL